MSFSSSGTSRAEEGTTRRAGGESRLLVFLDFDLPIGEFFFITLITRYLEIIGCFVSSVVIQILWDAFLFFSFFFFCCLLLFGIDLQPLHQHESIVES